MLPSNRIKRFTVSCFVVRQVLTQSATVILLFFLFACQEQRASTKLQQDRTVPSDLFSIGDTLAILKVPSLDEASGLAASRSNPDHLWAHNDSGGEPALFLSDQKGMEKGRYVLKQSKNIDWEDLAIGPGPVNEQQYLYVGDIGDNQAIRSSLSIYRVPEPSATDLNGIDAPVKVDLDQVERIDFVYEDGARDAEVLMIDPSTKHLYLVTKREENVRLYRLDYPQKTTSMDTAIWVSDLPFTYMTAGDISADGTEVLIKNYLNVYYWKKAEQESMEELLKRPGQRLPYQPEPQGEAIAWTSDASGYFTLSEKADAQQTILYKFSKSNWR